MQLPPFSLSCLDISSTYTQPRTDKFNRTANTLMGKPASDIIVSVLQLLKVQIIFWDTKLVTQFQGNKVLYRFLILANYWNFFEVIKVGFPNTLFFDYNTEHHFSSLSFSTLSCWKRYFYAPKPKHWIVLWSMFFRFNSSLRLHSLVSLSVPIAF